MRKFFLILKLVIIILAGWQMGFAQSTARRPETHVDHDIVDIEKKPYVSLPQQGGILFVEDPGDSVFGPLNKPDSLWEVTLDQILGAGNYAWYGPTLTRSENGPDSTDMMDYDLVIWNCYDYWFQDTAALTQDDITNLSAYFSHQGKVWVLGHDVLWSGVPMTFMQTYFHLQSANQDYIEDEPDINLHGLVEIDSISFLATADYAQNNFWPDALTPDTYAHVVLEDTDNNQDVGIFYPGQGEWQTAFWAIDGRSPNPYNEWINMVTGMLEAFGITGIEETPGNELARRLWFVVSPDPAVQMTTFDYNVPSPGYVRLDIYNRTGQHVTTIIDEYKNAGSYSCRWDLKNKNSKTVANGVYFARLTCDDLVSTASLVVVR